MHGSLLILAEVLNRFFFALAAHFISVSFFLMFVCWSLVGFVSDGDDFQHLGGGTPLLDGECRQASSAREATCLN